MPTPKELNGNRQNLAYPINVTAYKLIYFMGPGRVARSVGHLTRKSDVLGSIPGLVKYFRFSFC